MDYVAPTTIEDAVGALSSTPESRVFAGATDLIPQIRSGRPEPGLLVDLKRIERLTAVTEGADGLDHRRSRAHQSSHRGPRLLQPVPWTQRSRRTHWFGSDTEPLESGRQFVQRIARC